MWTSCRGARVSRVRSRDGIKCLGSSRASGRGKDSSRRMRTGGQQISGEFEGRDRLFTPHGGEIVEELIQGVTGGEVVEEVLHGHPSATKNGRAPKNLGVAVNDGIQRRHAVYPNINRMTKSA